MKQRKEKKFRRIDRRDALKWLNGEDKVATEPKLYFGYGSNLDIKQMKRRCKDSIPVIAGSLPGYRLSFSGVLTIESNPDDFVVGGIYEVSPSDEKALDRYEGFPFTYSKRFTHIAFNGARRPVFYYVLNKPYTLSPPMPYYYEIVEQGYKDWSLDLKHLKLSRKRAIKAEKAIVKNYYELDKSKWKGYNSYASDYSVGFYDSEYYRKWDDSFDKQWADALNKDTGTEDEAENKWSVAFGEEYKRIQAW